MLTWLTRKWRFRAAFALAALYSVCVIAPSLALANSAAAAHCLTEDHHGLAHVHDQGKSHDHSAARANGDSAVDKHSGASGSASEDEKQASHIGSCCGLFCFAAVTGDVVFVGAQSVVASRLPPALDESLAGRGPNRLNRPPIALQSL